MKKYFEVLRRCSLFDNIKDDNLMEMLGCLGAKVIKYNKRGTIFKEGEPAKYIGIVLSGSVQIVRIDYYGNRSIVSDINPSELFGESFACAGVEHIPIDAVAAEDAEIMLIDCRRVITSCSNACEFHNQLVLNLLKVVASKNLAFNRKIEITSQRTTRDKLMTYLMQQAKKKGSDSFKIPYDRQELADYLEVDRSGLSAEISKLRREGIIESKRSWFKLLQ